MRKKLCNLHAKALRAKQKIVLCCTGRKDKENEWIRLQVINVSNVSVVRRSWCKPARLMLHYKLLAVCHTLFYSLSVM